MLRKWHTLSTASLLAKDLSADGPGEIPLWKEEQNVKEYQPLISDQLNDVQRMQLHTLLDKFNNVLSNEPGKTMIAEHNIETGNANLVRLQPYRSPHAYRETVRQDLQDMEQNGIIEPSSSEWTAPIVLVKKKDGTLRFCVDYRKLNSLSQTDPYPMPRIDELIDRLGQAKYVTTLDLTHGYWQVPVAEKAREKTAFVTPFGLYQFRVMPFGLQGAPATFQRMMDRLLCGLEGCAAASLDNLVLYSGSWEEHLLHITKVFERLRATGLTAKPKKCQFRMRQCVYLGHVVGNGVVRPEQSKVETVMSAPVPKTRSWCKSYRTLSQVHTQLCYYSRPTNGCYSKESAKSSCMD